jgi:ribonuclease R
LGKHLRTRREKAGALAFETDEVRFELDTDNNPVRAYVKERLETMKVIEDWMLLANQEVATWVAQHVKDKKTIGTNIPLPHP